MTIQASIESGYQNTILLEALNNAAATLQGESTSEQAIFEAFSKELAYLSLRGGILLLDERKVNLCVKVINRDGFLKETLEKLELVSGLNILEYSIPVSEVNVYQKVIRDNETVYVSDTTELLSQLIPPKAQKLKGTIEKLLKNFPGIFSPLIIGGEVIGLMNIVGERIIEDDIPTMQAFANHIAVALNNARLFEELNRTNRALELAYSITLDGWVEALDFRDHDSAGHTQRVADLIVTFGKLINFPEDELGNLKRGALLHDVGKIGIPDKILQKKGKLTTNEWIIIKKHPENAYRWLSKIEYLHSALEIPYCHHEKWDGSGYPRGLIGEQIPLSARLFTLVDVWDAITSDRPYRKALSHTEALSVIREETGSRFDPELVPIFMEIIEN